jgi:hypothetical protein
MPRCSTPQAYALVIDALPAMICDGQALLIHWLSRSRDVPLRHGDARFMTLFVAGQSDSKTNRCKQLRWR